MTARHVVASIDEIKPGERKVVEVAGRSIGVFNVGGEFFALLNRCPHQGGPLCEGLLSGALESPRPGEYAYTRESEIIRCPWHGWEFDVRTGQSWFDPDRMRVRSYPATVESGRAILDGAVDGDRLIEGPYVAETYPVSVDGEYVTVELGLDARRPPRRSRSLP